MSKRLVTFAASFLLIGCVPKSMSISLEVGQPVFSMLRPATHRYVRYMVEKDGSRRLLDISTRRLSASTELSGAPQPLHLQERLEPADRSRTLVRDAWFHPGTFQPVERDNVRADQLDYAHSPAPDAAYDLVAYMELLQSLPLTKGRVFEIPFRDAGPGANTTRYRFTVEGVVAIVGPDGRRVDCWVLKSDLNKGLSGARFWLSKRNQLVLREENYLSDGSLLLKMLLPPEPSDEWRPDEFRLRFEPQ